MDGNVSVSGCGEPIPPSNSFRGRSSDGQERSLVRREAAGSNPVVPARGGRGVDGSTRGCDPRRRRFEPGRPPFAHLADAEHRRAQQAVTLSPRAVVVRLHPSALARGCSSTGQSTSLATRQMSVRLRPSPLSLRSVNGKHAPFVRPRCGFDSCRGLLYTPVAQRTERCSAKAEDAGSIPAGRAWRT
jgi:hypothetical protein